MLDRLPPDVLIEIFQRLPNKAIGMSMCVCKLWLHLVKDPLFVSTRLEQTNTKEEPTFLLKTSSGKDLQVQYSLHFDDERFSEHKQLVAPPNVQSFSLVGSCNGLVCFMRKFDTTTSTFLLWNPLIRKSITLPEPGINFDTDHGPSQAFSGFGYDARTNDYKVLRIVSLHNIEYIEGANKVQAEIFSLNSNSWKNITDKYPQQYDIVGKGSQAFVNDAIHWIARKRDNDRDPSCLVLALDIVTEQFREITIPERLAKEDPTSLSIFVHKESSISVSRGKNPNDTQGDIWVLKEYGVAGSWSKALVFGRSLGGVPLPLGFRRSGAILFQLHDGYLASVHPNGLEVKDLGFQGTPGYSFAESFAENLALLDKTNNVMQKMQVI